MVLQRVFRGNAGAGREGAQGEGGGGSDAENAQALGGPRVAEAGGPVGALDFAVVLGDVEAGGAEGFPSGAALGEEIKSEVIVLGAERFNEEFGDGDGAAAGAGQDAVLTGEDSPVWDAPGVAGAAIWVPTGAGGGVRPGRRAIGIPGRCRGPG